MHCHPIASALKLQSSTPVLLAGLLYYHVRFDKTAGIHTYTEYMP